jgi:hypothetical protein
MGMDAFASPTLGRRVPRVIWQKMQVAFFPEREGRDFSLSALSQNSG